MNSSVTCDSATSVTSSWCLAMSPSSRSNGPSKTSRWTENGPVARSRRRSPARTSGPSTRAEHGRAAARCGPPSGMSSSASSDGGAEVALDQLVARAFCQPEGARREREQQPRRRAAAAAGPGTARRRTSPSARPAAGARGAERRCADALLQQRRARRRQRRRAATPNPASSAQPDERARRAGRRAAPRAPPRGRGGRRQLDRAGPADAGDGRADGAERVERGGAGPGAAGPRGASAGRPARSASD